VSKSSLSPKRFSLAHHVTQTIWQSGSAETCWGKLQCFALLPKCPSWIKGVGAMKGRRGRKEKRWELGRKEQAPQKP